MFLEGIGIILWVGVNTILLQGVGMYQNEYYMEVLTLSLSTAKKMRKGTKPLKEGGQESKNFESELSTLTEWLNHKYQTFCNCCRIHRQFQKQMKHW